MNLKLIYYFIKAAFRSLGQEISSISQESCVHIKKQLYHHHMQVSSRNKIISEICSKNKTIHQLFEGI